MSTDTAAATDIIQIPHKQDVPALFTEDGGIEKLVARIEKEAKSYAIDISTAKGRKDVKSLAAKVSRSKTLIDEVGKELNEERNRLNKEVNAKRNLAKDRLDTLRDEIRKPVDEWEAKEADRVRALERRMDEFDQGRVDAHSDTATIQGVIDHVKAIAIDATWEEYEADARTAQAAALSKWDADLAVAKQREDQAAELEALRQEKERRDQEEEARRAAEAEAEAKAAADKKAKDDAEAAKAAAEAEAAAKIKEANERAERAAADERERMAEKEREEKLAEQQRAADKEHRLKIRGEIVTAITDMKPENYEQIVDAMIAGHIPHVSVRM